MMENLVGAHKGTTALLKGTFVVEPCQMVIGADESAEKEAFERLTDRQILDWLEEFEMGREIMPNTFCEYEREDGRLVVRYL